MNDLVLKTKIKQYKNGGYSEQDEIVCYEKKYDIYINKKYYISVMCLPNKMKEFIAGFLFSEGIIKTYIEIKDIDILDIKINIILNDEHFKPEKNRKHVLTTGCGNAVTTINMEEPSPCKRIDTGLRLESSKVIEFMKQFNERSTLFLSTGGVHACAIADTKQIIFFTEDIGRHNAYDKVIGYCLINNIDLSQKVLLTSGRISSEMTAKAVKAKVPIVISRSAPTSYGIQLAEHFFVTLIGFARGNRFNVYTYPERILKGMSKKT